MRGSITSPWQLEGTHTSSRNSRNARRLPLPCEMRPDPTPVIQEHSWARPHNSNGHLTFLRQHKRLPEVPVVPGEVYKATHRNSRQTMRFPRPCGMRPFSTADLKKKYRVPPQNSRGGWTPFMQLKRAQDPRRNSR